MQQHEPDARGSRELADHSRLGQVRAQQVARLQWRLAQADVVKGGQAVRVSGSGLAPAGPGVQHGVARPLAAGDDLVKLAEVLVVTQRAAVAELTGHRDEREYSKGRHACRHADRADRSARQQREGRHADQHVAELERRA